MIANLWMLLNRFRFTAGLALLAALASWWSAGEAIDAKRRFHEAERLRQQLVLATKAREGMAALQHERGYAMLNLASGGRLFAAELQQQFAVTTKKLEEIDSLAQALELATDEDTQRAQRLRPDPQLQAKLAAQRAAFGTFAAEPRRYAVGYASLVGGLLELVESLMEGGETVGLDALEGYFLLLHGAERASKEHALIAVALIEGSADRNTILWLGESMSYQDNLLEVLLAMAPKEMRSIIEEKLGREIGQAAESLRNEAHGGLESLPQFDGERVFRLFMKKSELVGAVFDQYARYLEEQLEQIVAKERNKRDFHAVLALVPWAVALLGWLGQMLKIALGRQRELIDSIDGIVWEADARDSRVTFFSRQAHRLLGYDDAVFLQPGFWRCHLHPDDAEKAVAASQAGIAAQRPFSHEYRLLAADGRAVWVHDQINVVVEKGRPRWLRGIMVDISARKASEAQLRLVQEVLENMVEGVVVTDQRGTIVFVNHAYCRVTGYNAGELIGGDTRMLKSGRQAPEFYHEMWRTLLEHGAWQGEMWNRRKNDEIYPERLSISAVRDEQGVLTHFLAVTNDLSEQQQASEKIDRLERFDTLTDLPNLATMQAKLDAWLAEATAGGSGLVVMLIDVDRFRHIVHSVGYEIGDRLLKTLSARLVAAADGGIVCRRGGDVFFVALCGDADLARRRADEIRAALALPIALDEQEFLLTASVGIAVSPRDGDTAQQLQSNAEAALRQVKDHGRDGCEFYDPKGKDLREFVVLEKDLRRALEKDELRLFYQPKVDATSGRIVGAEALLRWEHPQLGMVSPAKFIPVAEETGLIVPIGDWVIQTACRQLRAWDDLDFSELDLAVNISARQFRQEGLLAGIVAALDSAGVPARWLQLELTESILVDDPGKVATILAAIKETGVRLAIDDFGTGYSSLNYLKRYPIDCLKIDQSFVRDIHIDANDAAIVQAVIALARSLGLTVVAEGVEKESQLQFLRQYGCDLIQGYLFARPLPPAQFAALRRATPFLKPQTR